RRQGFALGQHLHEDGQLGHVLASFFRQFGVTLELSAIAGRPHQIPSLPNISATSLARVMPSSRSLSRNAASVLALGTRTLSGRAFSAATRTSIRRMASDTDRPISASTAVAFSFTCPSIRALTTLSVDMGTLLN